MKMLGRAVREDRAAAPSPCRATCERFGGTAGPVPSEVRLTRGRYGLTRWVSGRTMYDVSPAASTPRATVADVEALATALLVGT